MRQSFTKNEFSEISSYQTPTPNISTVQKKLNTKNGNKILEVQYKKQSGSDFEELN